MTQPKPFRLNFLGAARTVTGSLHLLEVGDKKLAVDCGMYQGRRQEAARRNRNPPRLAMDADALILTHAHIDHSGNIPTLVRRGFKGKIHCTEATADLCNQMLRDSARIQQSDAQWLNRKNKDDPDWTPIDPLYTEEHAEAALKKFVPHAYGETFEVFEGVKATLIDAGHILGSSSAVVEAEANGKKRRIVFSGDIGRRNLPILRDPNLPGEPDYVVMETTYGNRSHAPAPDMEEQLLKAIEDTRKKGGKVIIPSFALERAQEIVYSINQLRKSGRMEPMPVFVDSPLTVNLTEVFRRHPECYDPETEEFQSQHGDPFGFEYLRMVESVDESKQLNHLSGPAIIISASGMCEFGRVVHHLRNAIEHKKNTIVIVGYQAQHTLGRRLVEGRERVKIFGVKRDVRAEVRVLNAFSAHADREELLWWAEGCGKQVRRFFLVHGDPDQSESFAEALTERGYQATVPDFKECIDLD